MTWKLFLDDVRYPVDTEFIIARTVDEAKKLVEEKGCPIEISFDHDLGTDLSGYDFAKWLVEVDLDANREFFPKNFSFHVHSMNFVGRRNITFYLEDYFRKRK